MYVKQTDFHNFVGGGEPTSIFDEDLQYQMVTPQNAALHAMPAPQLAAVDMKFTQKSALPLRHQKQHAGDAVSCLCAYKTAVT